MAEVDAIGKKQKEIIDLQNELNALGNPADPGAAPAQFKGGYNRTDNKTFEYGTAYQVGKGDANTDNPVTKRYPLNTPNRKSVIAQDVKAYLANANKPYNDWKANSDKFGKVKQIKEKIDKTQKELTQLQTDAVSQLQTAQRDLTSNVLTDPSSVLKKTTVTDLDADAEGTTLAQDDFGAPATATQYTAAQIDPAKVDTVSAPDSIDVAKFDATKSQDKIATAMQGVQAAQGSVSPEALAKAATVDPTQTLVGGLQAAQGQATQVQAPAPLQMTADQTVSGTTVDQTQVGNIFGQQPLEAATVSGELDNLMQDFQGGQTPSWAAGAMRAATAKMAARGLGASSMAGMAIVQAAMESALPIAQMDAGNKQQIAIESARQRANFLQMEFTQEFEAKVRNATRVSEIANINFNAEQQVALENARLTQSMDLANLSNQQAIIMAEAAAISQLEVQNLTNQQQAAVQNANAFLQTDLTNLNNEQATVIFKAQQNAQSIFTDTAAENAALQINASSQNQANTLLANLKFNADQINSAQQLAIEQTNIGAENAEAQFNANVQNNRDRFNATNKIAIAQANALWRQNAETINTANDNAAAAELAKEANALTNKAVDELWQRERDFMDYVFTSTEDAKERALELILADKKYDEYGLVRDNQQQKDMWSIVTQIVLGDKGLDLI